MIKFIPLKVWITLFVYTTISITALIDFFTGTASSGPQWANKFLNLLSSPGSTILIVSLLVGILSIQILWRRIWKMPVLGPWFQKHVFPDLNGYWEITISSNYSLLLKGKDSDSDSENPSLKTFTFRAKLKQTWTSTFIEFLKNDESTLDRSRTICVELLKREETGANSLVWTYKQWNKDQRDETDEDDEFYGTAYLTLNDTNDEMFGKYWSNRNWSKGLNTAGKIKAKFIGVELPSTVE